MLVPGWLLWFLGLGLVGLGIVNWVDPVVGTGTPWIAGVLAIALGLYVLFRVRPMMDGTDPRDVLKGGVEAEGTVCEVRREWRIPLTDRFAQSMGSIVTAEVEVTSASAPVRATVKTLVPPGRTLEAGQVVGLRVDPDDTRRVAIERLSE